MKLTQETTLPIDSKTTKFYPDGIAYLIEERPLLWFEEPEKYDNLLKELFAELAPRGALECILVKNLVDYIWELRRMKKLKCAAVNFAMPDSAARLLSPEQKLFKGKPSPQVRDLAANVAYGESDNTAMETEQLEQEMLSKRITAEMIHYDALVSIKDRIDWIMRECERLEDRLHRLMGDYERRRSTLAAMVKSVVAREKAEVVAFQEKD